MSGGGLLLFLLLQLLSWSVDKYWIAMSKTSSDHLNDSRPHLCTT